MAQPNAALAYRVLDHIDAHPDEWNQDVWVCETAACFAGHALKLSGHKLKMYENELGQRRMRLDDIPEASATDVQTTAAGELGIDRVDSDLLFAPDNDRDALGDWVADIFGPRPAAAA